MLDASADPLKFSEVRALQHVKALSQDIGYRHVRRLLLCNLKCWMLGILQSGHHELQVATEGIETASLYVHKQLLNLQKGAARNDVDIKVTQSPCSADMVGAMCV